MKHPTEFTAQEARVRFREVLDAARAGSHVAVTRYARTEAYVVPAGWYEQALRAMSVCDAMASAVTAAEASPE